MRRARALRRIGGCEKGLGAVEFAMVAPVLALLFLGGYQLTDAISAHRKVTATARTLADVTTQTTATTVSDVVTTMNAARSVLAPYDSANATLRISEIYIPATLTPQVEWSVSNANDPLVNSDMNGNNPTVVVPLSIRTPGTYLILSEIRYRYTPIAGSRFIGRLNFTDKIFMGPRRSDAVSCPDCNS